jgi:carbonic anhydrase
MELHMVHQDSSNARAVISVLFSTKQAGHPSKTLTSVRTVISPASKACTIVIALMFHSMDSCCTNSWINS